MSNHTNMTECVVLETGRLAPDVYSLWLHAPHVAGAAKAGQFVSLYSQDQGHLLPRPISICEIDRKGGRIRLVYRIAGFGTAEFATLSPGARIRVMGPLGNGFPILENIEKNKKNVILIGGGIGIPPMLSVANAIREKEDPMDPCVITTVIGYRDRHDFLSGELYKVSDNLLIATDDGSRGTHGTVIDALNESGLADGGDGQSADGKVSDIAAHTSVCAPDVLVGSHDDVVSSDSATAGNIADGSWVIYACGPTPMLRGVKEWGTAHGIEVFLSLEERMACGIGACLACVCDSAEVDDHSQVKNKRVCCDGPVFHANEVTL